MNRRRFLSRLGASVAGLPLLGHLAWRAAAAQEGSFPPRLVIVFTGNGQLPAHWLPPAGGELDFTLSPVLQPLEPVRDHLLLLHGFRGDGSHSVGMSEALTGRPSTNGDGVATGGPSVDQLLADLWHGRTPLHSLEVGVMPAGESHDQICYAASGLPIPPIGQALGAFERVFSVTNADPSLVERQRAEQASVLDVVAEQLGALEARLDPTSRWLLDEHLTLVREQERDLRQPFEPSACDLHEPPTRDGLVETWDAHNDTITAAFRCDATRVATLRVGGWGGIESGGYDQIGIAAGHHDAAHGGSADPYNDLLAINTFHAQQVSGLVQRLAAVAEGDGTLLDNTVVIWLNEFGLGDFNHHGRADIHVVMAGGANLGLANGRYRVVDSIDYAHFLFTLPHLLGETGVHRFGDRGDQLVEALFS